MAIIGAAIFAWAAIWLVGEMTKPELYLSLEGVMADRKRLWNVPRDQGGTRDRDVSAIVCRWSTGHDWIHCISSDRIL